MTGAGRSGRGRHCRHPSGKWAGAWVAATVSNEEQAAVARAAGADLVVNRLNEDVAEIVKARTGNTGVDRIVDVNVKANLDIDIACLAPGGSSVPTR